MIDDRGGGPGLAGVAQSRMVGGILRIIAGGRLFAILGVLGAFLSAVTLYAYATLAVVVTIWDTIADRGVDIEGAKHLQVAFVELIDVYLLATVLIIVAYGLYQLFIDPDVPVPAWLKIEDLDQLTAKLIEVVGTLLGVTFLAVAVEVGTGGDILRFGLAIAVVIIALGFLLLVSHRLHRGETRRRNGARARSMVAESSGKPAVHPTRARVRRTVSRREPRPPRAHAPRAASTHRRATGF